MKELPTAKVNQPRILVSQPRILVGDVWVCRSTKHNGWLVKVLHVNHLHVAFQVVGGTSSRTRHHQRRMGTVAFCQAYSKR